jgi:putative ABC transport system permease protein
MKTDDFTIRTQTQLISTMSSTSELLSILLAVIAGISLVIGGIGIMNIMYVSVTERTREIGLRLSIGARSVDILMQFLIEAVFISVSGGILGIILGMTASHFVTVFFVMAYIHNTIVYHFIICGLCVHRGVLWVLSCSKGIKA